VRRVVPGYTPFADAFDLWPGLGSKSALMETWLPYLNGTGSRDAAIAALVARVGVK